MKNEKAYTTPIILNEMNTSFDEKALQDFLLDIECLDQLDEWLCRFNLFDILKITRAEIRHSNLLSWLLTPDENHGLKDSVIKGFVQFALTNFNGSHQNVFRTLLMDYRSFSVYREWHHIDIIAISDKEKHILCIENKIDSNEHSNQLARYQRIVQDSFPDYTVAYIYLSPAGVESSLPDTWLAMSYSNVIQIVESACKKTTLFPEAEMLINNYLNTIRRDIVGDDRLAKICAEIYNKHKRALDLIYENKPDKAYEVAEYFRNWCMQKTAAGQIAVVLDKCNKTYTRFKTPIMSAILPDAEEAKSGWNTNNHYFCEIVNCGGTEFYLQIAISGQNMPENLRKTCEEINKYYPSPRQKVNWEWRTHFKTNAVKIEQDTTEEQIYELLEQKYKELRDFEEKLLAKLENKEY